MCTGMIMVLLGQLFGENPRIVVSEETTVITTPLAADGLPDYQAYWRDLHREGVTPENNAAVLFWQAVWPGELDEEHRLPVIESLGLEKEPDADESLQMPYSRQVRDAVIRWAVKERDPIGDASEVTKREHPDFWAYNLYAEEVIDAAIVRPWTSAQIPPLAEWVAKNKKPIDLLVEASQRPRWWSPSPSLLMGPYPGSVAILFPDIQSLRDVARVLSIRAMWHAGEGRPQEAWIDLKALLRLARFTGEGPTLVGQLVAIAMDGIALDRTVTLLQHGEIDRELAREILVDLLAVDKPCDMVMSLDVGERISYADIAVLLARDSKQIAGLESEESPLGLGRFAGLPFDLNHILREGNRWFDRLVEAASMPTRKERLAAFADFHDDLAKISTKSRLRYAMSFFSTQGRSSLISDVMVTLMLPALDGAVRAEDRAIVQLDLARVAAALAVYRAERGEYPERLEQLVPEVLETVPEDRYAGKPFVYRRMPDQGYLLYSVFENETDDGGTNQGGDIIQGEWMAEPEYVDYEDSDLVIRVPMPGLKLPELDLPELELLEREISEE